MNNKYWVNKNEATDISFTIKTINYMVNYFIKGLLTFSAFIITQTSFAQAPQKMSYQAVIRDASSIPLVNTTIGMRISILQGSAAGAAVYVETQTPVTNSVGLVTIEIGTGTVVSGTFAAINWSTGLYWVKIETDPSGGTAYSIIGNSQLLSVPFALYAGSSPSNGWGIIGNSGTVDGTHFIGTTDNIPFTIKVNNQQSGRIDPLKFNSFWGYLAGFSNTTGNNNVAIGVRSLNFNTTSSNLVAVGDSSLYNNTGTGNTAVGSKALYSNTTGVNNTANGYHALYSNTSGYNNVAIGVRSMYSNTVGRWSVAIGDSSLYNFTGLGFPGGGFNTAIGSKSLFSNTTGAGNVAIGWRTLYSNTTGYDNTAVGDISLNHNTTGSENTVIGNTAMYDNTTGNNNTAVGSATLRVNTTGRSNTAIGCTALFNNTTGIYNTATGDSALYNNTSGNNNTAMGDSALYNNTIGNNNTALGNNANVSSGALSNATAIGANAIVNASNKVRIGNASVTVIEGQVAFTNPSDGRFKFNIQEDVRGLDFIMQLRPVTYNFDVQKQDDFVKGKITAAQLNNYTRPASYNEASLIRRTGFIAQEVELAAKKTGFDFDGVKAPQTEKQYYSLSYSSFVVPLVKSIQEQQKQIEEQKQISKRQNEKIELLQKQIEELKRLVEKLK